MTDESSIDELVRRAREGDDDATRLIFERFSRRLIGLVRDRLDKRVLPVVGPEDIVQSVFRTFFERIEKGEFEIDGWNNMWNLLAQIAMRKCGHKVRKLISKKGGGGKVVALDVPDVIGKEPTPSEAAILAETVQQVLGGLKERERRIFELHLQNHTIEEIREEVNRAEYTVRDVLRQVRKRLEKMRDQVDT